VAGLTRLGARHWQAIHDLLRSRERSVQLGPLWRQIHMQLEVGEPRGRRLHFSEAMLRRLRQAAEQASGVAAQAAAQQQAAGRARHLVNAGVGAAVGVFHPRKVLGHRVLAVSVAGRQGDAAHRGHGS